MIEIAHPDTDYIDFVPQAIFGGAVAFFEDRLGRFERAYDDLDFYEGLTFVLDGKLPFALRRYDGHAPNTLTVYLDGNIRDVDSISYIVRRIASELEVDDAILWQRAKGAAGDE